MYLELYKEVKIVGLLFQENYPPCTSHFIVHYAINWNAHLTEQHIVKCTTLYIVMYIAEEVGRVFL